MSRNSEKNFDASPNRRGCVFLCYATLVVSANGIKARVLANEKGNSSKNVIFLHF